VIPKLCGEDDKDGGHGPRYAYTNHESSTFEIGESFSLMGRLGHLVKPNLLVYGKVGLTAYEGTYSRNYGGQSLESDCPIDFPNECQTLHNRFDIDAKTDTDDFVSPTLGFGLEYQVQKNLTITAEFQRIFADEPAPDIKSAAQMTLTTDTETGERITGGSGPIPPEYWEEVANGFDLDHSELTHIDLWTVGINYHF